MCDANIDSSTTCHNPEPTPTPTPREMVAGWTVRLPRSTILEAHKLGPLIVTVAAMAWRARGPRIDAYNDDGTLDEKRAVATEPDFGWAALAGVTRSSWNRWLAEAVAAGLVEVSPGRMIRPLIWVEEGEQFARLPVEIMLDASLTRAARLCFLGLSLYRMKLGYASSSGAHLAEITGLTPRRVYFGLGQLKDRGVIFRVKTSARRVARWMLFGATVKEQAGPQPTKERPPTDKEASHNRQRGVSQPTKRRPITDTVSRGFSKESSGSLSREHAREAVDIPFIEINGRQAHAPEPDDGLANDPERNLRLFGRSDLSGLTPDTWCLYLDLVSRWRESEDKFYVIRSARRVRERMAAA